MVRAPAGSGAGPDVAGSLRLDVVTIFPDYPKALNLSLIGRAARTGLIDLHVHDLREWTRDRHRTVDDTPLGGGAGMVMRPDVWGEALDSLLAPPAGAAGALPAPVGRPAPRDTGASSGPDRQVLVIPTPAGDLFTQRTAEDLARADRIVFACGRYEGIDARVAEHYRSLGVEVRELSIGDYVLSGGEVAALVMIEAVARLRPGVLGNPASVVEESHGGAGLLEHPVHTRPVAWRGLDLADSDPHLLSGDHARIARARRDQALARTAARRPDMIGRLRPETLDAADRAVLARHGWAVPEGARGPVGLVVRPALAEDVEALSALAARTFPDACPPFLAPERIAAHIATNLAPERFAVWRADPRAVLTVAELPGGLAPDGLAAGADPADAVAPGEIIGYSVVLVERADPEGGLITGLDQRPDAVGVPPRSDGTAGLAAELSKAYVDTRLRSSGVAAVLLDEAVRAAAAEDATVLWLGTHERNRRAQRAYRRRGFRIVGSRVYDVGGRTCRDVVMSLDPREARHEH